MTIYHDDYLKATFVRQSCRDAVSGESTIKSRNTRYLPMPAAMTVNTPASSNSDMGDQFLNSHSLSMKDFMMVNPNYHSNKAYQAYLTRAQFPEITDFILRGLLGLALAEEPTIKLPKSMEYLKDSATSTGQSLIDYFAYTLSEVFVTGKMASVVDIDDEGNHIIAPYIAESLVNWKLDRPMNSSKQEPTMIVLEEFRDKNEGKVSSDYETIYRVWQVTTQFNDEGVSETFAFSATYTEAEMDKDNLISDKEDLTLQVPEFQGKRFKEIPIQMFGSIHNSFDNQQPPLASVVSSAIQIYMKYADLSNSEFMSCSPTLIISGVDDEFKPKAIGSTVALVLPDAEAKAYYTKTDTSALSHVLNHISSLYEQAIYAGAQILDSSKKAAESAETTRLKQSASGATLTSVVMNVAKGIESQLKFIATNLGEDPDKVKFLPLTNFLSGSLTAQEQKALVESWTAGAMSLETMVENFRRAGLLQKGESIEDEIKRILAESKAKELKQAELDNRGNSDTSSSDSDNSDDDNSSTDDNSQQD